MSYKVNIFAYKTMLRKLLLQWARVPVYMLAGVRSLCAFCYNMLCRHRVFALNVFGLLPFLWLRLRLKPMAPAENVEEPEVNDDNRYVSKEGVTATEDHGDVVGDLSKRSVGLPDRELDDDDDDDVDDEEESNGCNYTVERTDPLYCEYDSTWETSSDSHRVCRSRESTRRVPDYKFQRFQNAARDMYNYRHDYPLSTGSRFKSSEQGNDMPNLHFYLNKIPSVPDGVYISGFHTKWWGDYDRLEEVHTFIQWLFPLQESGMNDEACDLTKQEIEAFCDDDTAKSNLRESYKLMLDFYGIELSNPETGEVRRAENWQERFKNLNRYTHNNLRLTRILKCMGTLGFWHYQAPLVRFFLEETLVHGNLARVKESALSYFLFAVLHKEQRRELVRFAYLNYEPRAEFIWCPKAMQKRFCSKRKASPGLPNPTAFQPDSSPEEPPQVGQLQLNDH